jgi:hypothetical protein
MKSIRDNTLQCGYCGATYPKESGQVFCDRCLDSEYLKPDELKLLRLLPIGNGEWNHDRPELTDEERATLTILYEAGRKKVYARKKENLRKRYDEHYRQQTIEYNGLVWLLDHGIDMENCIYYSHLNTFTFGWRNPVTDEERARIEERIDGFPYRYEIK